MAEALQPQTAQGPDRGFFSTGWKVFALLVLAYLAYDFISYQLPPMVGTLFVVAIVGAVVVVGLVNLRWALGLFLVALIFADDISRVDPVSGTLSSILTISAGGVAVGNLIALALIALALLFGVVRLSQRPAVPPIHRIDACMLAILAVYAVATLHAYPMWFRNPRGVVNDLNLPIMLAGIYFLTRWTADTPGRIVLLWKLLLAVCAAKAVGWLLYFLLGIGFEFGKTLKVSNESGRVILILVFAWAFVVQQGDCPVRRRERILAAAWIAAAGIGLLIQAQRGPWLMTAFAFIVLLMFGRLRDKLRWLLAGVIGLIVTFAAVSYWMPDAFDTIRFHASSLRFWEQEQLESSTSTVIRIYEFKNIHAQMADHDNLILGEGPGATFSDNYHQFPFGIFPGDYTWEEIERRTFQNPHGLIQNLMLNLGYGGMLVYLGLIGILYWSCFELVRKSRKPYFRAIALALLAFLPAMVYSSWSPKNNMVLGVLFGIIGCTWQVEMARKPAEEPALPKASPEPAPAAAEPHTT